MDLIFISTSRSSLFPLTKFEPLSDLRDSSPCNDVMHRIHERISVHTLSNFYVYCSADQACKQHTVTFNLTSSSLDLEWTKAINAHKTEWGFVRSNSVGRKIRHLLSTNGYLSSSATKTLVNDSSNCNSSLYNPETLSDQ